MTPRRAGLGCVLGTALVMMSGSPLAHSQQPLVNPDAETLADFTKRVKAYTDLRNKIDDGPAALKPTTDPAKIAGSQKALAARIRSARAGARQGDIFTPAIEKKFRALLQPEVKGAAGASTKAAIQEEKPVVALVVNEEYPPAEPVTTVPPNILKALPPLPEGLEYRFVRKHLILRDTRANLIVDFLPNAIP